MSRSSDEPGSWLKRMRSEGTTLWTSPPRKAQPTAPLSLWLATGRS